MSKILKTFTSFISTLLVFNVLNSQSSSIKTNYDSIFKTNSKLYYQLEKINTYNRIVKLLNYVDTIVIERLKNEFNYYYKGTLISDFEPISSNKYKPLTIEYSLSHGSTFLYARSLISPFESREIIFNYDRSNQDLSNLKLSNFKFDALNGRYEERKADGRKIIEGNYCQIDSTYSIMEEQFDPNTYESTFIEYKREKYPIKIGTWKYYNIKGLIIKEVEYKFCKI
ncbi:MAG: hypothetical protein ABI851_11645 [Saprospiraceae bacterium]